MATVSSLSEFPGDDDDDSLNETNSSTTVTEVVYSPQWNRKSNMKVIPNKHKKNNKSIVDMQSNKQSSWCSSKLKISNDEPQSFHPSSSTRTSLNSPPIGESTHQTIFQSNQKPLTSFNSSSQLTSSDDFLNNNPFVNRLRNPSVAQKYGHSYFNTNGSSTDSSRNANFDTFFPESSTTADSFFDNLESRVEHKPSLEMQSKYISEHRFHWSENIEYCSPWVRHRAKEIADHVNGLGLFEVKNKSEVSENDSKKMHHKDLKSAEVVHEDSEEIDDDITYKIASKLCDTFLKHDETNMSDNNQCPNYQCPNDENFKWSKLYQKLINYGQL